MCDECRQIKDEAEAFVRDVYVWVEEQTDMPDELEGVGQLAATSAGLVARVTSDRLTGTLLGEMVMEAVRVAFYAGVRAARQEREAPNGEGELAPIFPYPVLSADSRPD